MRILFIDATTKPHHQSRTFQLASAFLDAFLPKQGESLIQLDLKNLTLTPLTDADTRLREQVVAEQDFSHPLAKYAHQFAQAHHIVIAAPYWDYSFPAILKVYLEYVCACGITFAYGEQGIIPLCNGKTLTYITTSGGEIYEGTNLGYDYISTLASVMFGIPSVRCLTAEKLDIQGTDVEHIMAEASRRAKALAEQSTTGAVAP